MYGLLIAVLAIVVTLEFGNIMAFGWYKAKDEDTSKYLRSNKLELNDYNDDILGCYKFTESGIDFIATVASPLFSKYYIHKQNGDKFQVLRFTKLHDQVKQEYIEARSRSAVW